MIHFNFNHIVLGVALLVLAAIGAVTVIVLLARFVYG